VDPVAAWLTEDIWLTIPPVLLQYQARGRLPVHVTEAGDEFAAPGRHRATIRSERTARSWSWSWSWPAPGHLRR
jgi:hypothetical protein